MTAVGGVFYGFYYRNLFPSQVFDIGRSIEIILAPIIGGLGTVFGPVVGAFTIVAIVTLALGIGGNTARVVGERLKALGAEHQVVCITHLPQVASLADVHFRLEKDVAGAQARASVERLEGEGEAERAEGAEASGPFWPRLSDPAEVYGALVLGVRDYVRKNGFRSVILALSGGIDSALTATIAADAIGPDRVNVVLMPSRYSSEGSVTDAEDLVRRQGLHAMTIPIASMVDAFSDALAPHGFPEKGLPPENLQARVRGVVLMGLSNAGGHLVLTTGNKSELATGYSTLYGDSAGGFGPIKDVPKTLVWELSRWRNAEAERRGLRTIDATCPLVTKVHNEAKRFARDDYDILLIGHEGHEEVVGTAGEAPDHVQLVDGPRAVDGVTVRDENKVIWLSQTTLSVDETMETVQRLRARFPNLQDPPSDDICYATQNRQVAVKAMAPECELVIVVGSRNSSNSVRLVEVALGAGSAAAHLVDYADDIDPKWLDGVTTIGVTSGASVPEVLVRGVLERLAEYGYDVVQPVTTANETLVFALPREIRPAR